MTSSGRSLGICLAARGSGRLSTDTGISRELPSFEEMRSRGARLDAATRSMAHPGGRRSCSTREAPAIRVLSEIAMLHDLGNTA